MEKNVKKLNKQWVLINGYWVTCSDNSSEVIAIKVKDDGTCELFKREKTGSLADSMLDAELHGYIPYIGYVSKEGFSKFLGGQKIGEDAYDIYSVCKIVRKVGTYVVADYSITEASRNCAFVSSMLNGGLAGIGYEHLEEFQDCSYFYNKHGQYIVNDSAYILAAVKMAEELGVTIRCYVHSAIEAYEEN